MSLPYFPHPHPDELLYSVLARFARHLGLTAPAAVSTFLLGSRYVAATIDLPCRLATLVGRVGTGADLGLDQIVDHHTLHPYYTAFLPPSQRRLARTAMAGAGRSTHFLLGTAGHRVRPPSTLRFCPQCSQDMLRTFGEPFWRRAHQLPGVLLCPDHELPLRDSTVVPGGANRHLYVAATAATCPEDASPVLSGASATTLDRLLDVSRGSCALLDVGLPRDRFDGVDAYRQRIRELGLTRSSRKVHVDALEAAFSEFYGETLDHLPFAMPSQSRSGWAVALLRAEGKSSPPLAHVLLQRFLARAAPTQPKRDSAPWRCENPLAGHRGSRIVTVVERRCHGGVVTGTFRCACGYAYRRRLEGEVAVGPAVFKTYGPTLEPVLRRMLERGESQRSMADAVGLDVKTMNRQAAALGLRPPWVAGPSQSINTSGRAWAGGPADAPDVAEERTLELGRGSPPPDWVDTDDCLVEQLDAAARDIRTESPALRITITELERRLGRRMWLRKRLHSLPRSKACVGELVETTEQFRRRRTQAWIRGSPEAGRGVAAWEVMRAVGLDGSHLPMIEAVIAQEWDGRPRA